MEKTNEMLEGAISGSMDAISGMEPGSEQKAREVENLEKLYQLKIDSADKEGQKKARFYDRIVNAGVNILGFVVPLACYVALAAVGYAFEESGSVTSPTLKGVISRFSLSLKK